MSQECIDDLAGFLSRLRVLRAQFGAEHTAFHLLAWLLLDFCIDDLDRILRQHGKTANT